MCKVNVYLVNYNNFHSCLGFILLTLINDVYAILWRKKLIIVKWKVWTNNTDYGPKTTLHGRACKYSFRECCKATYFYGTSYLTLHICKYTCSKFL